MKSLPSYRLLLLILSMVAGHLAMGQDDATSKFIDSLKQHPAVKDSTAAVAEEVTDTAAVYNGSADTAAEEELPIDSAITSNLKKIDADTLALLKKDKGFYYQTWLDSLLRAENAKIKVHKPLPKQPDLSFLDSIFTVFKIILWILAGALLVFVIYKLFLDKTALFLKRTKNIDTSISATEEVKSARKYESLFKNAEAAGDYRLAVRYLYLQSLFQLAEKGYVTPGTEKTNYQYINELRKGRPAITPTFTDLTFKYEYIWYGEYAITGGMYQALKQAFIEFNNETA